jgi:hypothetical protein
MKGHDAAPQLGKFRLRKCENRLVPAQILCKPHAFQPLLETLCRLGVVLVCRGRGDDKGKRGPLAFDETIEAAREVCDVVFVARCNYIAYFILFAGAGARGGSAVITCALGGGGAVRGMFGKRKM